MTRFLQMAFLIICFFTLQGHISEFPPTEQSTTSIVSELDNLAPDSLWVLAMQYRQQSNLQGLIHTGKELLQRTASEPFHHMRGQIFQDLAWAYYQLGVFDESLQHLLYALDFFSHTGDSLNQARVSNNLANIYSQYGDYEKALEF